eukprot:TRINITY_DN5853_c0_g1_i1.p1 TRINITY_DN5853_c0_g1~~TRINITY_DN5853_c0_g1_i1.p1  ORF type:complete len:322 (+),score=53.74 TRINITY_DN5853_c0_g1_i1:94-966(+)
MTGGRGRSASMTLKHHPDGPPFLGVSEVLPTVFFDLDGTLVPSEMHHCWFGFINALPNRFQRWTKLGSFLYALSLVGLSYAMRGERDTVPLIAHYAMRGVSTRDAEIAMKNGVTPMLKSLLRPDLLAEIKRHQKEGRRVAVISGSIEPFIADFCRILNCDCICTQVEVATAPPTEEEAPRHTLHDPNTQYYTGAVAGRVCVRETKVERIRKLLAKEQHQPSPQGENRVLIGTHGYGNSKNDLYFLNIMEHPHAVTPDSKLEEAAIKNGWSTKFHRVLESTATVLASGYQD